MATDSLPREAVLERWHELLFAVRRSRRYHMRREQFFARFHHLFAFLTAVGASAAFAAVLADLPVAAWLAGPVAFLGVTALASAPSSKALEHNELTRAFTRLERKMRVPEPQITEAALAALERRRLELEVREPPTLQVLNLICHNEEVLAGGYGREHFFELRWYQRLLASLFDLRSGTFQRPSNGG